MTAPRYSPLVRVMGREIAIVARLNELTDWKVSVASRARITGASGCSYAPEVAVRMNGRLHLIYMRNWAKTSSQQDVDTRTQEVRDIGAAHPGIDLSAPIFANSELAGAVMAVGNTDTVSVVAPPTCRAYAQYLIRRLTMPRSPTARSKAETPSSDA